MARGLRARDVEVLRSLLRLQVVSTASLQGAFFSGLRATQRCMARLRDVGLVTTHDKGLPAGAALRCSTHWRLTRAGLEAVARSVPQERIPDNHQRRAADTSLRFFEHRNDVADIYFALVRDRDLNVDTCRQRAEAFGWYGEHDVTLHYEGIHRATRVARSIVPDATLVTTAARLFLELDRSTESRRRCVRAAQAYASFVRAHYAEQFPDGLPPYVVYVTQSVERRESLRAAFDAAALSESSPTLVVLEFREALPWLAQAIGAESELVSPTPSVVPTTTLRAAVGHMTRLYEGYRTALKASAPPGVAAKAPAWLGEVREFLAAHRHIVEDPT